jgi:ubiquitin-activating enzyme E1 C
MASQSNSASLEDDWAGRYYHIDQVLNTPGPRTDPDFMAGDGVRALNNSSSA